MRNSPFRAQSGHLRSYPLFRSVPPIKGYLIKYLRKERNVTYRQKPDLDAGRAREEPLLSQEEAEARFLELAERGNHQGLMTLNTPISKATVQRGLVLAVQAGKENAVHWITTTYTKRGAITPEFIREILVRDKMSEKLRLFFNKHIPHSSRRDFSPIRYRERSAPQESSLPFQSSGRREGGAYAPRTYSGSG